MGLVAAHFQPAALGGSRATPNSPERAFDGSDEIPIRNSHPQFSHANFLGKRHLGKRRTTMALGAINAQARMTGFADTAPAS